MRKVITLLSTACILGLSAACTTTTTAPAQPHLSGHWQLDQTASDNPDTKIAPAIATAESKLRRRLVNAGFSQYDPVSAGSSRSHGGGAELNGDEYSQTGYIGPDFHELRTRLQQVLAAPRLLTIDVGADYVRLAGDNGPARDYPAGDAFTRIDEYGTAMIDSNWSGNTFVLRAKYASHASVVEHYAANERTGTLTVTRDVSDPVVGKISARAIYRQ